MGLAGGCARQGAPPGGPIDRRPPVVTSTVPDTFSVDTAFTGPVRFDFDERISERVASGTLEEAVVVSPHTGDVTVSHSRSGIEVKVAGGFRRGLVYRVTLLPVIRDMFNNRMHDPFDLVFSTGAPFVNSAVAGLVWDRVSGQPWKDMEVTAVSSRDTTEEYVARSDSAGIYIFRYLPPGRYALTAFDDRNRNDKVDPTEARGMQSVILAGADTVLPLDVAALRPDTVPARVKSAVALDSLTVLVNLDHYVDPEEPDSDIRASLTSDSVSAPRVARMYKEYDYSEWVAQYRDSVTLADSIAAAAEAKKAAPAAAVPDTTVRDTASAGRDTVPGAKPAPGPAPKPALAPKRYLPPLLPGGGGPASIRGSAAGDEKVGLDPEGKPLPKQRIVLRLDSALVPGVSYLVHVDGVTTVNGVPMAGPDTASVVLKAPKDTATAKAGGDSAKVKGDTAAVKDTTVVPDTLRAGRTPPDTSHSPLPFLPIATVVTSAALPGRGGGR